MRIGVIDSGVGGLTILQAVRQRVVADYIYVMDNRYLPYGEKSELFIQQRLAQLSAFLLQQGAELILIACNTATTQAVAHLRHLYKVPFVGTVPAIKPAATAFDDIGFTVLATPATCQSQYLTNLIRQFAQNCTVQCAGSSQLVRLAEQKVWYQQDVGTEVELELARLGLLAKPPVAMVLGCTHFPFLAEEIKSCLPAVTLFDTADAIARRVQSICQQTQSTAARQLFVSTLLLDEKQRLQLSSLGFSDYQCWNEPAITV